MSSVASSASHIAVLKQKLGIHHDGDNGNDALAVLDGGLATHLEDALHQTEISSSSLWSASLLQTDKGCQAIVQAHLDFLRAGAHVITTSTYQASFLTLVGQANLSIQRASELIVLSVELAQQARDTFLQEQKQRQDKQRTQPLICLGLGPYGAALSNGAEYTGVYHVPGTSRPTSADELQDFHAQRLYVLAKSKAWKFVDLITFETIPRLDEAQAAQRALKQVYISTGCESKPAFVSFVFPQGNSLPYPTGMKDDVDEMDDIVGSLFLNEQQEEVPFSGIGINCTKPTYLSRLVARFNAALARRKAVVNSTTTPAASLALLLYPDGGLVWDGIMREWKQAAADADSQTRKTSSWSCAVYDAANEALSSSLWSMCLVGGCCKATAEDIHALRALVDKQRANKKKVHVESIANH